MTDRALPSDWIEAALTAARTTDDVEVARALWAAREDDLRAAGDLLLTWQVLLRDDVAARERAGTVRREAGRWVLTAHGSTSEPVDPRTPWTPEQVVGPVEAYLAMLEAEEQGRPARRARVLAETAAAAGRPVEQVERIWSNVSHVLQEHGIEPLLSCPPRSNVPTGVRPAVSRLLGLEP